MRLTTWNVNGIRNPFAYPPWNSTARTFPAMFDLLGTDIVVMQELKIQRKDLRDDMVLLDGWDCYFSLPKHKKGYSGVGIYTRNATCAPIRAEEGLLGVLPSANGLPYCDLPDGEAIGGYPSALQVAELGVDPVALDAEGRCVVLEFPAFVLFGVYSPANSNGLRDGFRYGFICALDCRIRNLVTAGKRVVLVGDLNVSRNEMDTASAAEDCRKAGISHEQYISTPNRRIFNQLLVGGEVAGERDEAREEGVLWDTTRGFHPERKGMYTHWEQKINARPGNYGSRIDFVLVSESMRSWIEDADIQEGLLGSDHCPVFVDFNDKVQLADEERPMLDIMSPSGVFVGGIRKQDWKVSSVPAFSGKRMPEFEKRRSIKSMFMKKSESTAGESATSNINKTRDATPAVEAGPIKSQASTMTVTEEHTGTLERSQRPSSPKRKLSMAAKEKPVKKQKTDTAPPSSKGQQSLKGFFSAQSKSPNTLSSSLTTNSKPDTLLKTEPQLTTAPEPQDVSATPPPATPNTATTPSATPLTPAHPLPPESTSPTSPSMSDISTTIAAAEATQRSWSTLFSRPIAPLCEGHSEPCKTMQTKKKGSNQGRSFWMCARPLGPSGEKERGTEWRCGTFVWSSDWGGGRGNLVDP
ncbi:Class II abasic (AP) endonuclease [Extremus antarcticus]|uniref:DNA-(apurinic or apyrimidinic site) endonuclease 2 n=1 Tax=Extremus antarcticus TaxID=702011 RepID=A0AAJ0DLF9_9PEZI|nr:Class II abasic (AP) endonuclease [Extremus antarcticus]